MKPALVEPGRSAVLTMEMQRGVVGDLSMMDSLVAEVVAAGTIERAARLVAAARGVGVRVVHCTAEFRPDLAGTPINSPLIAFWARRPGHMRAGTPSTEIVPEIGLDEVDLVASRRHGVSPFTGTSLDATLRSLGVTTVIATGVSVNLAILGLCIEAVNLGYQVVVATDAVAGVPRAYADAVMENTLALLATRATVDEIAGAWGTADTASGAGGVPPGAAPPASEVRA